MGVVVRGKWELRWVANSVRFSSFSTLNDSLGIPHFLGSSEYNIAEFQLFLKFFQHFPFLFSPPSLPPSFLPAVFGGGVEYGEPVLGSSVWPQRLFCSKAALTLKSCSSCLHPLTLGLQHVPPQSSLYLFIFETRSYYVTLGWPQTCDLPSSVAWVLGLCACGSVERFLCHLVSHKELSLLLSELLVSSPSPITHTEAELGQPLASAPIPSLPGTA